jgi:uroporphyrinogen decarboxylase
MNGKERFLTALKGGVPDRVPAVPDISNYIPCKRTGLPYWDIYFFGAIPLWKAYLEAADHFGIEHWVCSCFGPPFSYPDGGLETKVDIRWDRANEAMIRVTRIRGSDGELDQEEVCFRADPPTPRVKLIKDFDRDWAAFRRTRLPPNGMDRAQVQELRAACAARGQAFGLGIGYPGLHSWMGWTQGGIEPLAYLSADRPELLDEWYELDLEVAKRELELVIAEEPDYVLFGGSGTLTLSSPELVARYAIPALAELSRMTAAAGIPSLVHSCGKSRLLLDLLARDTEVDCLNPLEVAPMGDVELAEAKRSMGGRIALMGNLHTTDLMLRGSPGQVYAAAADAMRDAGPGGGFILSTGDQCPRDTPDENIFALVRAAVELGVYDRESGSLPVLPPRPRPGA